MTSGITSGVDVTAWRRTLATPVRRLLRAESGSAAVLLVAIVAALVWSSVADGSYEAVWQAQLSIRVGDHVVARDARTWVNSGLMTLFFLVVGLEARQEFDLGALRERRRFVLPAIAGTAGMILPIAIYLAVTHGGPGSGGWGIAMSTDTALALGLLTVVGRHVPDRVRVFLLTIFVVDDVVALVVVIFAYSDTISVVPLVTGLVVTGLVFVVRLLRIRVGGVYAGLAVVAWFALLGSGVDPIVLGLVLGLATTDYTPSRGDLEQASGLFRLFREQPTAELARSASAGVVNSLSPNARLQNLWLPWTSYLIVPLFGLANAGVPLDAGVLSRAATSPITLGIVVGYVVGKPIAVIAGSWLVERVTAQRVRPEVGWAAVAGSGTIAGIGFTVSFVVASRALSGADLVDAKLGVLAAGIIASALTWVVYTITSRLPDGPRARALLGQADQLIDLEDAVDVERDHVRGPEAASVTLVEYGDLQCPYCGQAETVVRDLLTDVDLRYVWRHLPLPDVHPQAQLAAEATEAAGAQGRFWEMHDLLFTHQDELRLPDLIGYAKELELDTDRFADDLVHHAFAERVERDVESADGSGVSGTPTFFINGQRHYGAYDVASLQRSITVARARARISGVPDHVSGGTGTEPPDREPVDQASS